MLTPRVTNIDATQNQFIVDGIITPTLNYGTAGAPLPNGDTLDFSQLGIPSNAIPTKVEAWSVVPRGNAPLGDKYYYLPGTTQANGVLQIVAGLGAAEAEFVPGNPYAGAAPTNVVGYVLHFRAWFPSFAA